MFRILTALSLATMLLGAMGCNAEPPGRTMLLGQVDQQLAFTTAKDVVSQYFEVDPAGTDAGAGVVKCRPQGAQDYQERLLGSSPTRELATLQIYSAEGQTAARISVAVQQMGSSTFQTTKGQDSYSGVPNDTPVQGEAATTAEQNQTWKTVTYKYEVERKILADLYRRLHPESK